MKWRGVTVDTLLQAVELDPTARYVTAFSDGGYTTNVPLDEMVNGQAFVAYEFDDKPLAPEHGGPARLVVPHLYFWKSAKWIRGLRLMDQQHPRILGDAWVPHPWRPLEGGTLQWRLTRRHCSNGRSGTVTAITTRDAADQNVDAGAPQVDAQPPGPAL